ncbi:DUF1311 domain-containing protein [Pigmentiphaga aceris]|uniref:DUF1311 domain-containing protein n=2 Tax=Pigmentiphaga aceris TaxID=1940612 RepID=A0A5C0B686_9BURK|nr:DUF1311 domain-containing protein [Pigmentiphaga aceris]
MGAHIGAHAANGDDLLSKQYSACMDNSGGVTVKMQDCISAETKRQDVTLNEAYKNVMDAQTPARKKQLTEVQRMWLKYREANCKFYADPNGGTLASVSANVCFMNATASRAAELAGMVQR